tara:strand:+ start:353 stop:556 length:204 start_codon:yes stop_codon:yes gene_type:complete
LFVDLVKYRTPKRKLEGKRIDMKKIAQTPTPINPDGYGHLPYQGRYRSPIMGASDGSEDGAESRKTT